MSSNLSNVYIKILALAFGLCRILLKGFLAILYSGRKNIVPPVTDPILLKSAVKLAEEIREGKTKSEDVIKSYVARIKLVNPYVNAICEERFDAAITEAQEIDQFVASHKKTAEQIKDETPLLGVPFTVKVLIGVKGMTCNAASLLHKDVKAHEDGETVALLKKAGALCIATTNSPEFGLNYETYNKIYGTTSNPYDTRRTAGGSSGGEGALIGAGASLMGIGNDLGGSIRHPSHFNGIFGHKATVGMISNFGVFPPMVTEKLDRMLSTGPMCRYSEDLILATRILSGSNVDKLKLDTEIKFSQLKIYYAFDDGNPLSKKVSHDIRSIILDAALHFQSTYGTEVKHLILKEMKMVPFTYVHELMNAADNKINSILVGGKSVLNPTTELFKKCLGYSDLTIGPMIVLNINKVPLIYKSTNHTKAQKCLKKIEQEFENALDDKSVLIFPSFPCAAHYHNEFIPMIPSVSYLCIFNLLGYPVTQCPIKLNSDKLPIGLQIIGLKGQDHLLLKCAQELEKVYGGWIPPNADISENGSVK